MVAAARKLKFPENSDLDKRVQAAVSGLDFPPPEISTDLSKLYQTQKFTDFKLSCGTNDDVIITSQQVHKCILSRIEYFRAMLSSGFSEGKVGNFDP
jgi:hypothetical protein